MKNDLKSGEADSDILIESKQRLPIAGLLALATAAFVTLLTEIMPAGLLSSIARTLTISESLAGQFITAYAIGALAAAIPVTTLTQGMRRRGLLLVAIGGFAVVNLITALSGNYTVSLVARFFAGVFGGIVWSLLAGYAVRISPPQSSGRAIAISGAGATVALVLGVPLSALLGSVIGWQGAFGLMTALSLILFAWVIIAVPDFPGQTKEQRQSIVRIFMSDGLRSVLFVVFSFVVAHNILYIYIEPLLEPAGLSANVEGILFIFGLGSIIGLWVVGTCVDRHLQALAVTSVTLFGIATVLLGIWGGVPQMVYLIVVVWGVAVGGFATITQTALSRLARNSVDVAQAMYTTGWNTAVAAGGIVGGILLGRTGTTYFGWVALVILAAAFSGVVFAMNRSLSRPV